MPKVNGKSFPYTAKGMAAAEKAEYSAKTPKAMKMAVKEGGAVAAKKAALKKKIVAPSKPAIAKAMPTGAAPKKAAPSGTKMIDKQFGK